MDNNSKDGRLEDYKPPFSKASSPIESPHLILPPVFSSSSAFHALNPLNKDTVFEFLRISLDLRRLDVIQRHLWLAGLPRAPRSLHYQKILRREIVVAEQMELHLVTTKSRTFIKPLPDYLLNYDFWQEHICSKPEIYRNAFGLLFSYCGLIRYNHDLQTAQEAGLINTNISFSRWSDFARMVAESTYEGNCGPINERFRYGELRLERLHTIYRFLPPWSINGFLYGYPQATAEGYVPFLERYNGVVSALGIVVIILTAMQVGLGTKTLQSNNAFQQASFGFTAFSIILSAALVGSFFIVPFLTFVAQIAGAFSGWKFNRLLHWSRNVGMARPVNHDVQDRDDV